MPRSAVRTRLQRYLKRKDICYMKRILCAVLACTMLAATSLSLAGCGDDNSGNNNSNSNQQQPGYKVEATEPDLKDDNFGYFILDNDKVMITRYYGDKSSVEIPSKIENYTVTSIGKSVFDSDKIQEIVVPDTVTDIQDYAFASNRNMRKITLSKNLKKLGTNVFFNCMSLESLELPASLESIGAFAFCGAGFSSITIPESKTLTELPQYAFQQCPNLKEITLSSTLKTIPDNLLNGCPEDLVIKAPADTPAAEFAKNSDFEFEEI